MYTHTNVCVCVCMYFVVFLKYEEVPITKCFSLKCQQGIGTRTMSEHPLTRVTLPTPFKGGTALLIVQIQAQ